MRGYEWPDSNHGITVDYKGNVWIGGNGRTVDARRPWPRSASNAPEGKPSRGASARQA